ncbi:MAG TPA: histidine phosphatase family protein [Solirubrobacteraceae bacterium]
MSAGAGPGRSTPTGGPAANAVLVRHAETEWTLNGRHTGRTDIPLTEHGRDAARALAAAVAEWSFARVLTSPLRRAFETCELCGLAGEAERSELLVEWDYGDYEGLTSAEIERLSPGWSLWRDGCPGGEHPAETGARADRVIALVLGGPGPVAVFSHGHFLRVLGARWIELAPSGGARLGLSPGSLSVLGEEHGARILAGWNRVDF